MKLSINWDIRARSQSSINLALKRYMRHLEDKGLRESTIEGYVGNVGRYLNSLDTDRPSSENLIEFRTNLFDRKLSRSTINNYTFAMLGYHGMLGDSNSELKLPFLSTNNRIRDYFSEDDIIRIFAACYNLKHLTMLQILFYGCLRASELCNLDDGDLDLKSLTVRIRDGKGGKNGIIYIQDVCARTLRQYLAIRPSIVIDGRQPLFFSDFGRRWKRKNLLHVHALQEESWYRETRWLARFRPPHASHHHDF